MQEYWQSLEQLASSPEIIEKLSKEFPGYDPVEIRSLSRRRFMQLMSASMALAGLTLSGCRRWPKEELAPYSSNPRQRVPGVPEQYATVYDIGGVGTGLLVTSFDGRPIKIEGNPSHPFCSTFDGKLGASDAFAQASVLELYDPDRSRVVVDRSGNVVRSSTWEEFEKVLASIGSSAGGSIAVLSEAASGRCIESMRQRFAAKFPGSGWYEYEPLLQDNERVAFGKPVRTRLYLDRADVVVSLDADLLGTHPAHLRYANDWAKRRRGADEGRGMNRLYVAESALSPTGSVADDRLGLRPSRMMMVTEAIAAAMGVSGVSAPTGLNEEEKTFVEHAATDLKKNGVITAGAHLPPRIHGLVDAINRTIGAYGTRVALLQVAAPPAEAIKALCEKIQSKQVQTLIILGGNPAYDAPADLGFAKLLATVPQSIHLSLYDNETSAACKWHLPRAHYLESWGDARAWDGTISFQQPLILPLYGGKSPIELLAMLTGDSVTAGDAILKRTYGLPEAAHRRALHDGVLVDSAFATIDFASQIPAGSNTPASEMEIAFVADRKIFDGRFANNGWLQELPDSISKLTWDNAALISKADADKLGIAIGDMIRITSGQRSIEIAAFIQPGQPIGVIALPLGYGRTAAGRIGNKVGFDTYALRGSDGLASAVISQIEKTGATYALAATQEHHIIDPVGFHGREERVGTKGHSGSVIRDLPLSEYGHEEGESRTVSLPMFQPPSQFNTPHAWGMAIDMSACVGCAGCVVACQAENNIPIVGKDQVIGNREMHWLRIDRYFKGTIDDPNPDVVYQPMMCVHCENAPCEQVCPVAATMHDSEGLNTMVYNRCIGTRYCSNNCPYKVRRFNYFDWHSKDPRDAVAKPWLGMPDSQQLQTIDRIKRMVFNPEVTVRMRGVMEKCTYCVQRIHNTEQTKRSAGQDIQDGDVVSACQQACPTEAIVFGNLNDPNSRVSKLHANRRAYGVLDDLNTKPRTLHLAKLRNPGVPETATAERGE